MNVKVILAAAAVVALAGCAGGGLSEAEKVEPQGSEFDNALSAGYLRLARSEQAEADYGDADYFAERAIMSAEGTAVPLPEANAREASILRHARDSSRGAASCSRQLPVPPGRRPSVELSSVRSSYRGTRMTP